MPAAAASAAVNRTSLSAVTTSRLSVGSDQVDPVVFDHAVQQVDQIGAGVVLDKVVAPGDIADWVVLGYKLHGIGAKTAVTCGYRSKVTVMVPVASGCTPASGDLHPCVPQAG